MLALAAIASVLGVLGFSVIVAAVAKAAFLVVPAVFMASLFLWLSARKNI
jgi:hypothetical protein